MDKKQPLQKLPPKTSLDLSHNTALRQYKDDDGISVVKEKLQSYDEEKTNIKKKPPVLEERIKIATDQIMNGIDDFYRSDRWRQYLSFVSAFHQYSPCQCSFDYDTMPDPSTASYTLTEAVKRYYTQLNSYSVDDEVIVTRNTVESMLNQFGYKTDEEKTAFLEMRKSVQSVISASGTAFTNAYTEYINQYAEKYELDTAMIYAIIEIESGFSMENVNNSLLGGSVGHGLM